jgi:hypothetical protein
MPDPAPSSKKVKGFRLVFWACCAATGALPVLDVVYAVLGRDLSDAAILIGFLAFAGLCFSSGLLVDDQPELARRGMRWSALFLFLVIISGFLLGPIQR